MRSMRQATTGSAKGARRSGQALLIAVLLMMAILLIGIFFVAIVTYNQSSSSRHEDMLLAQALAEGGVRYADHMLRYSPQGADWRPPDPPAQYQGAAEYDPGFWGADGVQYTEDDYYTETEISRGWAPLRNGTLAAPGGYVRRGFTRYPDPRQPGSTSAEVNNFTLGRGYFLLRVTYDPDPPYEANDPTPHVADPMSCHIKIESIGRVEGVEVYRKLLAYKPVPLLNYLRYVTDGTNTGKPAQLGFAPFMDMNNDGLLTAPVEWIPCVYEGPIKINSALEVAGAPNAGSASTKFRLTTQTGGTAGVSSNGYLRDDTVQVAAGVDMLNGVSNAAEVAVDGGAPVQLLPSSDPAFTTVGGRVADGQEAMDSSGYSRFDSALAPPSITLSADVTGAERYRELTRDSGDLVLDPATGSYVNSGTWGHGAGVYVDNNDDVQFADASTGKHDLEALIDDWQRPQSASGLRSADSGWNALYTTYAPVGIEIELLPTEAAAGGTPSATAPAAPGSVWWPNHIAGEPGIKLTRHDGTWKRADGTDSGDKVMVVDYPLWPNQVIFAEGNVRIKGQLPPAARDGTGNLTRSYDLTVVSNATIYIDGQILSPQDVDATVRDEDNTKVALLARDCVCLNTTQVVPQLTSGVPAVPDDEENPNDREQHWELSPGSDGRTYSLWWWGESPAGNTINLVVKQTAADPGPSGVGLTLWDAASGTYTPFVFAAPAPTPPLVDTTFLFVPPGTVLPGGVAAPTSYCSTAIAPNWEALATSPPTVPWDITSYLNTGVGVKNAVVFKHEDPHLSAGSTDYWVKKWKVEQLDGSGNPVGAIGARVNAVVYAERGCWYVLTSDYFDKQATGADAVRFRRYNYKITFKGAIAENFTARVGAVRGWTDRTAFPEAYTGGALSQWGTIKYIFDESLRIARDQALTTLVGVDRSSPDVLASAQSNLPKLPLLPVSPDLVYYGEAQ